MVATNYSPFMMMTIESLHDHSNLKLHSHIFDMQQVRLEKIVICVAVCMQWQLYLTVLDTIRKRE